MTANYKFSQVDVFTDTPLKGNPVAVVHGADALSEAQMQAFAKWTNLSETTFLLQPTDPAADYRVRIFTPSRELSFAGHPTLGSCHAWLQGGGTPRTRSMAVQQCGVGLVRLRLGGEFAAFAAPPVQMGTVDDVLLGTMLAALGLQRSQLRASQWLHNGPKWLGLLLDSAESVLAIEPNFDILKTLPEVGVVGPYAPGHECQFELRAFAPGDGIPEDPVTGSFNAGVGQWLIGNGMAPSRYLAAQGCRLGRAGRISIEQEGPTVWVGGHSVSCIRGELTL